MKRVTQFSAFEYMNQALEGSYEQQWFYEFFAQELLAVDRPEQAKLIIEQGLKIAPHSASLSWLKSQALFSSNPREAYFIASGLGPQTVEQYLLRHSLAAMFLDFGHAEKIIQAGIEKFPEDERLYQAWIQFYTKHESAIAKQLKANASGVIAIEQAENKFPHSANIKFLKSAYYNSRHNSRRDYSLAIKSGEQALLLAPGNPVYQASLAKIYWQAGNYDSAARLMQVFG